ERIPQTAGEGAQARARGDAGDRLGRGSFGAGIGHLAARARTGHPYTDEGILHRPAGDRGGGTVCCEGGTSNRNHRPMKPFAKPGFTLVELLIVVVIIGILAMIAIPTFQGTKGKAIMSAMKSDLRNLTTAEEGYLFDHDRYRMVRERNESAVGSGDVRDIPRQCAGARARDDRGYHRLQMIRR